MTPPEQHAKEILLRELATRTTQEVAMDYGLSVTTVAGLKYSESFTLTAIHARKVLRKEIAIQQKRRQLTSSPMKGDKSDEYKGGRDAFDRPSKGKGVWGK